MNDSRAVPANPAPATEPPGASLATLLRRSAGLAVSLVALLLATGCAALAVSSHSAATVERITTAQSHHQRVDMLHDTIRSTVLGGVLAAEQADPATARGALADLTRLGHESDAELGAVAGRGLPDDLAAQVARARTDLAGYVDAAAVVIDGAASGGAPTAASVDAFNARFEQLERELGAITDRFALDAASARTSAARDRKLAAGLMVGVALAGAVTALGSARRVRRTITTGIAGVTAVATRVAAGDLDARCADVGRAEIVQLGAQLNVVAGSLQQLVGQLRADADQSTFSNELAAALDMADAERDVCTVASRAMATVADGPIELLLADSSEAHLERAATHPVHGAAGCCVESPFGCAAVRRGSTVVFRSSEALDACPKLVGRGPDAVAAVCAPVSFMGRALGVLHTTQPADLAVTHAHVEQLGVLATAIGTRIGTVRAFARSQLQASTDSLTGLMNRRSMEERLSGLLERRERFALAVVDLDHFKALNDTYGHHCGDRALGLFSEMLRSATRTDDIVARWGGEEFTIAFPDLAAPAALRICERVREALALGCTAAGLPSFTASFGIADSSVATTVGELFAVADEALYAAKDGGRNRCVIGPVQRAAAEAAVVSVA